MKIRNLARLPEKEYAEISLRLAPHKTLGRVLEWAAAGPPADFAPRVVAEVVTQDEFTHDVVVPYRNLFLVYDTT
jgi:hypothetical protein